MTRQSLRQFRGSKTRFGGNALPVAQYRLQSTQPGGAEGEVVVLPQSFFNALLMYSHTH